MYTWFVKTDNIYESVGKEKIKNNTQYYEKKRAKKTGKEIH